MEKKNMKNILIVEDDPDMQEIYKDLIKNGYKIITTKTAAEALKHLKKKHIDLMILDIVLPKKSGDIFFKEIKENPKLRKTKVIVVTVLGDVSDYFQSIDASTICISKPFDKDRLLQAIYKRIND
ncbi:MAG TPA: response regulator [Candidatus Nanoarchaeia archaeon]|nr:response regulator [Candidatus Nanoarchaeia archaeon]